MTIFIGADHRGFELKNKLVEYLQDQNIRVEDLGAYSLEPLDDNPDYAKKVAEAILQKPNEFLGILICGTGVGVAITANRSKGIRCGVGFDITQVKHIRENDIINILALPADYVDFEKAKELVDTFIKSTPKNEEKYLRRMRKMDLD